MDSNQCVTLAFVILWYYIGKIGKILELETFFSILIFRLGCSYNSISQDRFFRIMESIIVANEVNATDMGEKNKVLWKVRALLKRVHNEAASVC